MTTKRIATLSATILSGLLLGGCADTGKWYTAQWKDMDCRDRNGPMDSGFAIKCPAVKAMAAGDSITSDLYAPGTFGMGNFNPRNGGFQFP